MTSKQKNKKVFVEFKHVFNQTPNIFVVLIGFLFLTVCDKAWGLWEDIFQIVSSLN